MTLADRRVATFVGALLRSAGFDVETAGAEALPTGTLWVVGVDQASPGAAQAFLEGARERHVLAVGPAAEAWREVADHVITEPTDVDAMRNAIGDILGLLGERLAEDRRP